MGVTIHYRGQLNNKGLIHRFIAEVKDIAEINNWEYRVLDDDWNKQPTAHLGQGEKKGIRIIGNSALKGIQFTPHPECEPCWLHFNSKGYLTSPFHVALEACDGYPLKKVWLSTKTQFAGPEVHIRLIGLLDYLRKKYIGDLEIRDDSRYWENRDRTNLDMQMQNIKATMDKLEEAFGHIQADLPGDIENLSKRIEDILKNWTEENEPEQ